MLASLLDTLNTPVTIQVTFDSESGVANVGISEGTFWTSKLRMLVSCYPDLTGNSTCACISGTSLNFYANFILHCNYYIGVCFVIKLYVIL